MLRLTRPSIRAFRPVLPILASIVVLLAGCTAPPETTESGPREVPTYTIEEFLGTTSYFGSSFSADNSKVLVTSAFRSCLHHVLARRGDALLGYGDALQPVGAGA